VSALSFIHFLTSLFLFSLRFLFSFLSCLFLKRFLISYKAITLSTTVTYCTILLFFYFIIKILSPIINLSVIKVNNYKVALIFSLYCVGYTIHFRTIIFLHNVRTKYPFIIFYFYHCHYIFALYFSFSRNYYKKIN